MEEDEESQADGFVVDDGYLSAGEGGPIDNDDFGAEVEGRHPHSKFQLHLTDLPDAQLPHMAVLGSVPHDKQRCTTTACPVNDNCVSRKLCNQGRGICLS